MTSKTTPRVEMSGRQPIKSGSYDTVRQGKKGKHADYTSDGVSDHDILSLPSSDYQILGVLTLVTAVVRLFRIYQPSSVVFDEVQ